MKCSKCSKVGLVHRHHVIYQPEKIEILCPFCHSLVTSINTRYAKWKNKIKLTNSEREMLFQFFMTTDKNILEAVLNKKDKVIKKKAKRPSKKQGKYNPLYREDE